MLRTLCRIAPPLTPRPVAGLLALALAWVTAGARADETPPPAPATPATAAAPAAPAAATATEPAAAGATSTGALGSASLVPAEDDAVPVPAHPGDAERLAERDAAYKAFRADFSAGRYSEALPHAERVVALTEDAATDPAQLPSALNNLGATHYKIGDYIAAERAYARALKLVEQQQGAASKRLLPPLRGLALTYQAGGRQDAAAPLLERALAISRRSDGLFNADQLELIEPLIDSYVSSGRWQQADQLHQYAFRVEERRYGSDTPKLVPSLGKLAAWYEETRRFSEARRTWARVYAISTRRGQESLGGAINALRGMARTFRLEYLYGPEEVEAQDPTVGGTMPLVHMESVERDAFGRRIVSGLSPQDFRLDPQGKEFLEAALKMLQQSGAEAPHAEGTLLVELGDWTMLAERDQKALPYWQKAWALLPKDDPNGVEAPRNPLLYPAQLLYRPPAAAVRMRELPAEAVVERVAIAEFTVGTDGRVRDAKVVEGDASEGQKSSFLSAISRAVYRPRFVDGKPVATEKVRYRETFRERKQG
jgi:tetratricopeptide (TPR) repeat protein